MYFDKNYEDYIKSVLGEQEINNSYNKNTYNDNINSLNSNEKYPLEDFYPEIYKIIYPMINKRCSKVIEPLTKDLLEEMADEIYSAIEGSHNEINLNINIDNKVIASEEKGLNREEAKKEPIRETRGGYRHQKNNGLRDLIKILLIRELIGRPQRPGNIPPRPPHFPGRPPIFEPRPPMRPRGNESDIYEH